MKTDRSPSPPKKKKLNNKSKTVILLSPFPMDQHFIDSLHTRYIGRVDADMNSLEKVRGREKETDIERVRKK